MQEHFLKKTSDDSPTVFIDQELKAVLLEDLDVLQEHVLTDCSQVEFLWAGAIRHKTD